MKLLQVLALFQRPILLVRFSIFPAPAICKKGIRRSDRYHPGVVVIFQVKRNNLARIRGGKGDLSLTLSGKGEHGNKQALTGDQSFTGAKHLVKKTAALQLG